MLLGKPKDSGREDWGTLGEIKGITTPPLRILLNGQDTGGRFRMTYKKTSLECEGSIIRYSISIVCVIA